MVGRKMHIARDDDAQVTARARRELSLSLYGLVTSGGELEIFSPVVDDDHVDLVAGRRGAVPALGIQVKTADGLDVNGLVEARASFPEGELREEAAFVYGVLLLDSVRIRAAWLVTSPDVNRQTYRYVTAGRELLEFRASLDRPDAFLPFGSSPGTRPGASSADWVRA